MKYLLAILLTASVLFGQEKIDEQGAIKKSHIDLKKEYVYFQIHGWVETDGHTFCNDTTSNPFIFHADLEGTKIYRKNEPQRLYQRRVCDSPDCNVLHLEVPMVKVSPNWYNGIILHNDRTK